MSYRQYTKLQKEVEHHRTRLEQMEGEMKIITSKPEYRLADALHDKMCHFNHTDGCGWHYEPWHEVASGKRREGEKGRWIGKAKRILKRFSLEDALAFIELI